MTEREETTGSRTAGGDRRAGERPDLFRAQALEHLSDAREHGDLLRLPPAWTRWSYPLVAVVAVAGLLFLCLGSLTEYAGGPAIVRLEGAADRLAASPGTVAEVRVVPGQAVSEGELLVQLHDEAERAEFDRALREYEGHLAERLRDPGDEVARRALIAARAQLELAGARLRAKRLLADRDGVVADVRVRPGMTVRQGDLLLSLTPERVRYSVIALIPGRFRPLLSPGQQVLLDIPGFAQARDRARVSWVAEQIVGPQEARRFLGPEIADGLEVPGPVVLLRAELPSARFRAAGGEFSYYDGMVVRAEIETKSEPLIVALVPALRRLAD